MGKKSRKKSSYGVRGEEPEVLSQFQQAVEKTEEISTGYMSGLQALGSQDRSYINLDPRLLDGSVNIDEVVRHLYQESARWDYVIGYMDHAYFVEVHPASTSSISDMLEKAKWLEWWLKTKAPLLQKLRKDCQLYWIPSGNCKILPSSPQAKRLAKSKLTIVKPFKL